MTETVQPYSNPEGTPVGHLGTRVDIHERQAWAISGWLGVLTIAVCIAVAILLAHSSVKTVIVVPIVVGTLISASLVRVSLPGPHAWGV